MRWLIFSVICFSSTSIFAFNNHHHNQILVVITDEWSSKEGQMWCFERCDQKSPWKQHDKEFKIYLGSKGLAWGRGLYNPKNPEGPIKKEGDNCSPAGIFAIGPVFGFLPKDQISPLQMPYIHITSSLVVINDAQSCFYNQIVDKNNVCADWKHCEKLIDIPTYQWGAVIEYNSHPAIAQEGSAIFITLHHPDAYYTKTGSTCVPHENLVSTLYWLKKSEDPVIIQLPRFEYLKLQKTWNLPDIQ